MSTTTAVTATTATSPARHDDVPAPAPAPTPPAEAADRARRLWSLLPVAALSGAAGYGFTRVFPPSELLPVLAVAVPVPVVLSAVLSGLLGRRSAREGRRPAGTGSRPTTPLWPSALLTVVAWAAVVSATLFHEVSDGLPGGPALRAAWSALLDAPHALLSTILPAPGEPELLVLPHAVVWTAAAVSAELALRTRAPLLPALPAILAFGVPLVLGADGPGTSYPAAGVFAGAAALLVLVRSRVRIPLRALALRLPAVAALGLVAALLGPHLPGVGSPYDLRETAVTPPAARPQSTSPLDQVAAWMRNGDEEVFTVRTSGTAPGNYRLAVLDRYDGTTWSSGAGLTRTGGRVPAEKGAEPDRTKRLEQRFTVRSLPGIWLPAADRPTSVRTPEGTSLSVDPDSGVLSTGEAVPRGFTYTATSRLPEYDAERLRYAAAADDPARLRLPAVDAAGQPIPSVQSFRRIAERVTAGSTHPYQRAVRLADWLRATYRLDSGALPGHTYRNLEFFLADGGRGTSEQFAASFAVLGRTLGLPTRVAVGFRPGTRTGAGTWRVRGEDVLAWPEVGFAGVGWVPFHPTPGEVTQGGSSAVAVEEPEDSRQTDRETAGPARPSTPRTPDGPAPAAGGEPGSGVSLWLVAPVVPLLLVTGYVLYALWLPYRRRSRRRGDPDVRRRVLGAWQQITERLTEIGLPATGAHTAQEVAAFGAASVGGDVGLRLPELATLVNEVEYADRRPDAEAADAAWADCEAVESTVRQRVPRRTRLLRLLRSAAPGWSAPAWRR
ncbi:transglutaminase domain-containing protein [Streptomyces lincolnensis]|uniref:Transglutaminase domain-containing protein n=1 Tax=Streptomyces lincolnensis TaxID=1915 RepID=A0A1B1MDL2_STRLN|nr:transglutaminase domain-containing protein [Streptomyces lincolnensis]ANS66698.1 transglutaminase domain-containing protein [Streptomyces lincolnensis]AXG55569.1 transglutaminase domain-containing protein [Streptomyces lincolnensis]